MINLLALQVPEGVVSVFLKDSHVEDGESCGRGQRLATVLAADPDGFGDVLHPDAGVLVLGLDTEQRPMSGYSHCLVAVPTRCYLQTK